MIKVLINGINGKMGSEVAKLVKNNPSMHLLGGFDRHILHNLPYKVFNDFDDIFEKPDVIIDFSTPEATIHLLTFALVKKIPLVIATTGFSPEQKEKILEAAKEIPIFQSANMSYEISLMNRLCVQLSQELPGAEIEIVEVHHNRKKDAPSGTALMLADSINDANHHKYHYDFNRLNKSEKREQNEIGFSSIRGGNIVGEHSVLFFKENETFEIKHTCYSRSIFAEGSIKAAEFIIRQQPGYYAKISN